VGMAAQAQADPAEALSEATTMRLRLAGRERKPAITMRGNRDSAASDHGNASALRAGVQIMAAAAGSWWWQVRLGHGRRSVFRDGVIATLLLSELAAPGAPPAAEQGGPRRGV
jgi:hypothetical protein